MSFNLGCQLSVAGDTGGKLRCTAHGCDMSFKIDAVSCYFWSNFPSLSASPLRKPINHANCARMLELQTRSWYEKTMSLHLVPALGTRESWRWFRTWSAMFKVNRIHKMGPYNIGAYVRRGTLTCISFVCIVFSHEMKSLIWSWLETNLDLTTQSWDDLFYAREHCNTIPHCNFDWKSLS